MEGNKETGEECLEGDEEFEKPIVTNLARRSVVEYHLAPAFPLSTFSSIDDLDGISNVGSSSSSRVPSSRSSPIPPSNYNTTSTYEDLAHDYTTLESAHTEDTDDDHQTDQQCPPRIIVINTRGEPMYPRTSEDGPIAYEGTLINTIE